MRRDDLLGHRASFKGLQPAGCALSSAPALWRTATTFGLLCHKRGSRTFDAARSGLYVKVDGRPVRRLPIPAAATRAGATTITDVDLRVMKTFPVHNNRAVLQVGIEAFNLANHTNPARVSQFYAAGGERMGSYGQAIETLNARQVQFMIQFEY